MANFLKSFAIVSVLLGALMAFGQINQARHAEVSLPYIGGGLAGLESQRALSAQMEQTIRDQHQNAAIGIFAGTLVAALWMYSQGMILEKVAKLEERSQKAAEAEAATQAQTVKAEA